MRYGKRGGGIKGAKEGLRSPLRKPVNWRSSWSRVCTCPTSVDRTSAHPWARTSPKDSQLLSVFIFLLPLFTLKKCLCTRVYMEWWHHFFVCKSLLRLQIFAERRKVTGVWKGMLRRLTAKSKSLKKKKAFGQDPFRVIVKLIVWSKI